MLCVIVSEKKTFFYKLSTKTSPVPVRVIVKLINHFFNNFFIFNIFYILSIKKKNEMAKINDFGFFFMNLHEIFVRNGRYGLFFMKVHENFVRNRTKWPLRPFFHEFS